MPEALWFFIGGDRTDQISGKMYQKRNLSEELKHQIRNGTMTNRLIIANVSIFLLIHLLLAVVRIKGNSQVDYFVSDLFTLTASWEGLLFKPWGIITNIFAHFDLFHIFSNMIFLYFSGRLFEQLFDGNKLLIVYLIGGILGGLSEIISSSVLFPLEPVHTVLGASGSVMAIFTALAFYRPNMKVFLFGMLPVRLFVLALFFLATDLIGIGSKDDHVAHFAHLGGALFGYFAMYNIHSYKNILARIEAFVVKRKGLFKKKPKMYYTRSDQHKSDEQYNLDKKKKQKKTDHILDKISSSGYDSLTKEEKDFLFNQSKNG